MAQRRPLVLVAGDVKELASTDELLADVVGGSNVLAQSFATNSIANSVAETNLIAQVLPTDFLAGDALRLTAWGEFLNNTGANVNFTPRWKLGATTLHSKAATAEATATTPRAWRFVQEIAVETPTAQRSDLHGLSTGALAGATFAANVATVMAGTGRVGSIVEDLNGAPKTLVFSIQMGTANANASMTVLAYILERLRA